MKARTPKYMIAKSILLALAALHGCFLITPSLAGGNEVVVIYNSRLPESKALAYFYARKREVPPEQILGFDLATTETMSRAEFRGELQQPLAKKLEDLKLWRIGKGDLPGTNGTHFKVPRKVVESKIRYAVLCYGVPLRVQPDAALQETIQATTRPELRRNGAAVDSELACLPQLAAGYPLTGPHLNPLYASTNAASLHPTNGILLVARLDGPTAEIARGLVEKAVQAETDGLWGRAYFDVRNIADPGYKIGDDWIRGAAQIAQHLGFDTVVDENSDTFTASFPMSQIALYMGWYRENVSGPFTWPTVEFMPGAFAYHLHSFSAATLRATNQNWAGPLLAKGATCTMGSVDEPYLTGTPDLSTFAGRWLYFGFTFGEAAYAALPTLSWQTTVVGDPLYRPFGKNLLEQHRALSEATNRLAEWSILRLGNLNRMQGLSALDYATALEEIPLTKSSAVLTEKLAELYTAQGKPASAIAAFERALKLHPTPQQRLRLRLTLGEKLLAAKRDDEARQNYEQLLAEIPDYPEAELIRKKFPAKTPAAAN
jgi:uncharacterized protein (TIGR03790 family)